MSGRKTNVTFYGKSFGFSSLPASSALFCSPGIFLPIRSSRTWCHTRHFSSASLKGGWSECEFFSQPQCKAGTIRAEVTSCSYYIHIRRERREEWACTSGILERATNFFKKGAPFEKSTWKAQAAGCREGYMEGPLAHWEGVERASPYKWCGWGKPIGSFLEKPQCREDDLIPEDWSVHSDPIPRGQFWK